MGSASASSVEIKLPSRFGFEKVAMSTAASVARLMGFSDDRVEDLKTALAEACINAIEHGNKLNEELSVCVILSIAGDSLEVKVVDEGEGKVKRAGKPDIDRKVLGQEDPRGMGMFLIQSLVDEAEWVNSARDGHYIRLVIHLNKPSDTEPEQSQERNKNA